MILSSKRELGIMKIDFEELTRDNYAEACYVNREDIPNDFVSDIDEIREITEYGIAHNCMGHTYIIKLDGVCSGYILLGEALRWETDPPQMQELPFYRLMGFVIDKNYRSKGIGGEVLEKVISQVYKEFGIRPIALGCHKDNHRAEEFYKRHGFVKTEYLEGKDYYFLRYPSK